MPFSLPDFNLVASLWRSPDAWPGTVTATSNVQLYLTSRPLLDVTPGDPTAWVPPVYVRFPALFDVRPDDQLEVPSGTDRIYRVRWVDDCHKGFSNEYRVALVEQENQPFPLP